MCLCCYQIVDEKVLYTAQKIKFLVNVRMES
jgi:hypothetical protein